MIKRQTTENPVKKSHYLGFEDLRKTNDYLVNLDRDIFNLFQYTLHNDFTRLPITVITGSTQNVTPTEVVLVASGTGAVTVNLPQAFGTGKLFYIKNIGSGLVTIDPYSSETIDGETTLTMNDQWDCGTIIDSGVGTWNVW